MANFDGGGTLTSARSVHLGQDDLGPYLSFVDCDNHHTVVTLTKDQTVLLWNQLCKQIDMMLRK